MKKQLRRIKIRRGTDAQRKLVIFEEGEPVFIKDSKNLYIGDDSTLGGILVSNKNVIDSCSHNSDLAAPFNIIYSETEKVAKIVDSNGKSLALTTNNLECCEDIKKQIDELDFDINNLVYEYKERFLLSESGGIIIAENDNMIVWN